jgi:CubicO group peptidase (beta-lactamase class C family)
MIPKPTIKNGCAGTALAICAISRACFAASPDASKIDRIFSQWEKTDSPGMSVVVVKDGAVAYQHGYGCANLEHRIPITPQTVFDVASVAKQFTGLGIAMLVGQGKIGLGDDIRKYLPEVPDFGKAITIANLLHHTSGLRDWPETLTLSGVDGDGPITLDMILEMVRRQRELDFAPGEEHLYSNTGYNLLAAVIAKITGQSFRAWMNRNVFKTLGMRHTQVRDDPAEIISNFADSYAPAGGRNFRRVQSELAAQGSSSLLVSAEDMGKWLLNFETAQAGGKAAIKLMQQPGKLNNGEKVDYGFGIAMGDYHGSATINHSGSWAGYRSLVLWIPDKRFGIAILANTANADTHALAMKVAALYLGDSSSAETGKSLTKAEPGRAKANPTARDPSTWDRFAGTYRLGPGWLLSITSEKDQLIAQATNEDKFRMRAVSDTTFFVDGYGAAVEFVPESSGAVTHLLYRGINAPKLSLPELTPDRLANYAGDYWSEELQILGRVEIHDGKLALHDRSGAWIFFLPTGANRFDADRGGFSFQFDWDSNAKPTEVKVSGGRVRNLRYKRVVLSSP